LTLFSFLIYMVGGYIVDIVLVLVIHGQWFSQVRVKRD
jgi:hypothetical protein